jgi:hypothetical protein
MASELRKFIIKLFIGISVLGIVLSVLEVESNCRGTEITGWTERDFEDFYSSTFAFGNLRCVSQVTFSRKFTGLFQNL